MVHNCLGKTYIHTFYFSLSFFKEHFLKSAEVLLMTDLAGGGGGTPYNGLYGVAPPERGTLFRIQVYKRVGILHGLGTDKRVGKSVI